MEGSDVFAQEISGTDDPFAGTDLDFDGAPAEGVQVDGQGAEPVPVVDREGQRVDAPQAVREDGAVVADPSPAQSAPAPAQEPAAPSPTTPPSGEAQERPYVPEQEPGNSAEETVQAAPPTPADAPVAAPAEATGPSAGESSSSPQSSALAQEEADEGDAEPPQETKDKSGRVTRRRYLIFKVDGPGKLTQVTWSEDRQGRLAERGKRQSVYLARGTEDALKFGYLAAGAPRNGLKLVAVAALHFQEKDVKPLPPEPAKQRLQIR